MGRKLKWFLMLNKRLYKKASFVCILLAIPLCVLALGVVSKQDSGMLHITLAQENPKDKVSTQIIEELKSENNLIMFSLAESPEAAIAAVKGGKVDAAWIFNKNLGAVLDNFVDDQDLKKPAVKMIVREDTVPLSLTREKISSLLFKYCGERKYLNFTRENVKGLNKLTDTELVEYYNNINLNTDMFQSGTRKGANVESNNYLLTPTRGLMAILMVLCSMAAAMYFIKDSKLGAFNRVPEKGRIAVAFACCGIAVLNVAAVTLVSLYALGITVGIWRELLVMLLYVLCCTAFSVFLQQLLVSIKLYGALIPAFLVAMFALSPTFIDIKKLGILRFVFPPTHYIYSVYNNKYLIYMALYTAALAVAALLINRLRQIRLSK